MFRKIAVPLDGSTLAERALPPALALVEKTGGELHLVNVVVSFPAFAWAGEPSERSEGAADEGSRKAARRYLQDVAQRIAEAGYDVVVRTHVLTGTPAHAVAEWTTEERVNLLVMTPHGRGRVERVWLGSVADGLVRRAPCPILLWRADDEGNFDLAERPRLGRILVTLDGSDRATEILPPAEELARLHGADLSLLAVLQNPPPVASPYSPHLEFDASMVERHRKELEQHLASATSHAKVAGVRAEATLEEAPVVVDMILAHAKRTGADVLALSTRGRGGAARLVLGSVADKVVRASGIHVLVHRGQSGE
jgi:nucleotide-binding universal stress UspA family protein